MNNNFDKDFDKQFNAITKVAKRSFKAWVAVVIINGLVGLTLFGGLLYVIFHFVSKHW